MAELPNLGKHCSAADCQQLDFLPFECKHCTSVFCKEHFPLEAHSCSSKTSVTVTEKRRNQDVYACSVDGCAKKELTPVICPRCAVQVCLAHRAELDHRCSKYEAPKETMVKTKEVVADIARKNEAAASRDKPKMLRNVKSQKTAAKVQLMKLKQRANGNQSLPQEERVYFKLVLPKSKGGFAETFVSKLWTVGRTIDEVATVSGTRNRNNVSGEAKLRLFRFQDGKNLCAALDKTVGEFVADDEIFNGDCLVLEYVDDSQLGDDIDPKQYT